MVVDYKDRALTRRQAAAMTGYREKTFANFSTLGIGPPFRKYRGRTFYIESQLLDWVKSLPEAGGRI